MLTMKQTLKAAVAAIGVAGAMSANAFVVGGIDFGSALNLSHLETATMAQTFINGNGQTATSYGSVSTVNGSNNYCAGGGSCGLYYVASFGNSQNFTGGYVEFTTATISVFYTNTNVNLLTQNSVQNLATIQAMTPWLTLTGHNNLGGGAAPNAVLNGTGSFSGQVLNGFGGGLFDVSVAGPGVAAVAAAFNTNTVADAATGFADVQLTSSFSNFVLNANDEAAGLAAGCKTGTAAAGAWCYQGTTNLRGTLQPLPEPASLALVGLGLGVAGVLSRRRRTVSK